LNYTRKVGDFTWVVRNTQLDSYSTAGRRLYLLSQCRVAVPGVQADDESASEIL